MPQIEIHASAVVVAEAGILIRGASGSGKSRLALALIASAEGAGLFCRLVGDDRIRLENSNGRLIARGHPLISGQIEQRGAGVLRTPFVAAAVLRLLVDLVPADRADRFPKPAGECFGLELQPLDLSGLGRVDCAGVSLPALVAPDASAAADLAAGILWRFRL